jgi:hypothetical protein
MEVLIELNGTVYPIPTSGEEVRTGNPGDTVKYVGMVSGPRAREDRVLSEVPRAPSSTTIDDLNRSCPDISRDAISRILRRAQARGEVTSSVPAQQGRGRIARRWMRR